MCKSHSHIELQYERGVSPRLNWSLPEVLATLGLPLLFAIRLWASVCLALFIAFWLELDSPYWAGGTAAIVCQPQLGASLRKGWFRMIGTSVGAVAIVVVTACFPQDRVGYLGSLALFCSLCAFAATVLRNFASYAAALAGTTAAIIATANLGATAARARTSFWLRSIAPARSASGSPARAWFSRGPISAARGDGSLQHLPTWLPRPQPDSPGHWRGRQWRARNPSGTSFSAASSRSNLQLTRPWGNPATCGTTR